MNSALSVLEVSWTSPAFTVPEGDGSIQVCATLTCTTLSPMLLGLKVTLVNNTAVEGIGKNHAIHLQ